MAPRPENRRRRQLRVGRHLHGVLRDPRRRILHPQRLVPDGNDLMNHQALFLTRIHPALHWVYVLGIFSQLSHAGSWLNYNVLLILSPQVTESQDNFVDVASWVRFLREQRIPDLFASLADARQPGKTKYPIASLVMWAFSACAFRTGSKNALHTSLSSLKLHQYESMLDFLGIKGNRLPHVSTVDNALANLSLDSLSMVPINLVKQLEKRKFFYNHSELFPENALRVAFDGYHTHTYDHPHATHEDGTNACPYCLPRTRHKGTEKETTYWVHTAVTIALICNGMTLPLYFYPLKATQVNAEQSDEKLKEECELKATQAILPIIRKAFPKMAILFLGDALYANRPMIRLCNELNIEYLIVLKEGSLKKLNKKCNELNELDFYRKHYRSRLKRSF